MKKLLAIVVTLIMVSCSTYRAGYHGPVYGVVEDVVMYKDKYRLDVWDYVHMRYYKVTTDRMPQIRDTIRIR